MALVISNSSSESALIRAKNRFVKNGTANFGRNIPTEMCGPPPEVIPNIPVKRNRNGPFHFNSDQNYRNLWHNGKHPGSPRFTDFPSLCACSESSLTNLIGSGLNLLCSQSHSKTECRWTGPEVAILGADQNERGLILNAVTRHMRKPVNRCL